MRIPKNFLNLNPRKWLSENGKKRNVNRVSNLFALHQFKNRSVERVKQRLKIECISKWFERCESGQGLFLALEITMVSKSPKLRLQIKSSWHTWRPFLFNLKKLGSLTLYVHATTAEKCTKKRDARAKLIAFSGALAREARHAAGHHGLENEVIYPSEKIW